MKKILDIGCGDGHNMYYLSKWKQNLVIGIELSQDTIRIAKKRYPNLDIRHMNAEKIKFQNQEFDEVYAIDILEHVDKLDKVVKEIYRVIKVGGKLIVGVPYEKSERLLLKIRPSYFREIHHVRIFKGAELEQLMAGNGFNLVSKKRDGFLSHINLIYQFLTTKKSNTQCSIGDWRDNIFSRLIFVSVSFFQPYILKTNGKYIPIWIITLPIGYLLNYFGNKRLPKSIRYEFIRSV